MYEESGEVIAGRYRLDRMLGRGGFGATWAGVELSTGRQVAVKALDLSRVDDWKAVDLFEREARTLESLDHPRIPDYVDFIPVADAETGYLVQELAPGADLQRVVVQGGSLSEDRVQAFAHKMLDILEYLAGCRPPVVHRDIKPSNILMDENDDIYLVDFGSVQDVARRTHQGGSTVAGTFGYMAPEQLRGIATPASDLYGLGMTMLFLLSGHDPGTMPQSRLKVDFRKAVKVSRPMAEFIDRLIEPAAEDRFATPTEARQFLQGARPSTALTITTNRASGSEIARLVEERKSREEMARQRALERASQRERRLIEKLPRRIQVEEDEEGCTLALYPVRFRSRLVKVLPITGFLFVNPGFAIAGGFPFAGAHWPIFSEFWPGRWVIWFLVCLATTIFITRKMGRVHYLRVTRDGHFALSRRGKKEPLSVGRRGRLFVTGEVNDGYGEAVVSAGDEVFILSGLNPLDVHVLREQMERI